MTNYSFDQYMKDMMNMSDNINRLITKGHKVHIIGIFRGSLPIAVHLSNILPAEMSIIKFQSRDGKDKEPTWVLNNTQEEETLIVVDDIYDSGKTMKEVMAFLKTEHPYSYAEGHVLVGSHKAEEDNIYYYTEHDGSWIVFPWELDNVSKVNESVA